MPISDEAKEIQAGALKAAREYGYSDAMSAPPGKFEGESFYALYYHDAVMNGMAESFGDAEHDTAVDLLDVTPAEREAFGLGDEVTRVALYTSSTGFVTMALWTDAEYDEYMSEQQDEEDFDALDDSEAQS